MSTTRRSFVAGMLAAPLLSLPGRAARAARQADVIVIGGGLAGLNAALLLQEAGAEVTLLEGDARIGGRVYTADHVETRPEFGASQIGRSYARTIALCRRFDLSLVAEERDLLPMASRIRGSWVNEAGWQESPANLLAGEERGIPPALLASRLLGKYNPLSKLDDWLDPAFAHLDVSLHDLLREHGHSPEALRLANITATGNDMHSASCLSMMQEQTRARFDLAFSKGAQGENERPYGFDNVLDEDGGLALISNIEGGASRLPEAMAGQLGEGVQRGRIVRSIDLAGKQAEVACLDGSRYRADFIISAIPFTSLRRVLIDPAPAGLLSEAIHGLDYAHTSRAFGTVLEPYWDDALDPSMFTDGSIDMLWAIKRRKDEAQHRFMVVFTGASARQMDQIPRAEVIPFILAQLERIRPSTRGRLKIHAYFGWQNTPFIGGCRHMFAPGQVSRFAQAMIQPFRHLHFAGEHTRRLEFGMEAALESGERAAVEVLGRMA